VQHVQNISHGDAEGYMINERVTDKGTKEVARHSYLWPDNMDNMIGKICTRQKGSESCMKRVLDRGGCSTLCISATSR
jgi:ABC-type proline/glycine betaine transport system substrate-binding protein